MTETTTSLTALRTEKAADPRSPLTSTLDRLDTVQWRCYDGTLRTEHPSPGLLHERLWETEPIRQGAQYRNRPNEHGLYYWPWAGQHISCESALELASLVDLDHQGEAVQIAAQPFRLLFHNDARAVYPPCARVPVRLMRRLACRGNSKSAPAQRRRLLAEIASARRRLEARGTSEGWADAKEV
jgi:hypothetical protein